MQGMKRFLKGKLAKVDRSPDPAAKSRWIGVQNSTKNMTLEEALNIDKQNEEKEMMLKSRMWFHPDTNRNLAETKLRDAGLNNGMFLIRPSAFKGNYVLSLVAKGAPRHYHIKQRGNGCYYVAEEHLFRGVDQFVDYYLENSAGLPTQLRKPCPGSPPPMECRALGYTNLLHQCIIENETSKALKILSHRLCPNVNAKNSRGNTALHEACVQGQEKVVQKLIERGADTSSQQLDGYTPLMLCCIHNKPTIIRLLVTVGKADPQDAQIPSNNVALHEAAAKGHLDCIKMLLGLKAPAWPRNCDGTSPHDVALAEGHRECAKYIDNFTALPAETHKRDWYHGEMGKPEAEAILRKHDCREGVFLVRKSSRRKNLYILVLSSELRIYNYEIHEMDGIAFYIDSGPVFSSLEHVVEYYSIRADGLPTRLVYGIEPGEGREVQILGDQKNNRSGSSSSTSSTQQLGRLPAVPPAHPTKRPPEPDKLNRADLEFDREIGEGEYGSVYRGTWTAPDKSKHKVAIKTLHVRHTSARENFLREARVMVQLDHHCIVQLIGVCTDPSLMLVQELVPLGSMLDYMLDYPDRININPDLFIWASQIASGMNYLEEQRFVHRDLAARNILLKSKTQAKVGDFGLSRATGSQSDDYQASVGGRWPIKWYAPECVNFGTFSSRSDVWSYGITLWEMFTLGEPPYGEKTGAQVIAQVDRGVRLNKPRDCSEEVYKLMLSCWEYEPTNRPTFKDLYRVFCEDYSEIPGIRLNAQSSSHI